MVKVSSNQSFNIAKSTRAKSSKLVKVNYYQLSYLVDCLIPYYPELRELGSGLKADFMFFLLEKALKDKKPDYVTSWEYGTHSKSDEIF